VVKQRQRLLKTLLCVIHQKGKEVEEKKPITLGWSERGIIEDIPSIIWVMSRENKLDPLRSPRWLSLREIGY
jgi:hypothetical protein